MSQNLALLSFQGLDRLYGETMALIEETSRYGQKQGRLIMQSYAPEIANFYARQMRRLSIRLYQIATFLMLARAVRDGDMECSDAMRESEKITLEQLLPDADDPAWNRMENFFFSLNQKSLELARQANLIRQGNNKPFLENAPHQQLQQIEAAFGKG